MKKGFLMIFFLTCIVAGNSNAQLLKKIKSNVDKALNGKDNSSSPSKSEDNGKFKSSDYGHVKYKLDDGETLVNGEECTFFDGNQERFLFITKKNGKYYFHDSGRVSGPFEKPPIDSLPCWNKEEDANRVSKNNNSQNQATMAKYQTMNTAATVPFGLKIGGKSYGPYNMIQNLYVNSNETKFYAIVMMLQANGNDMDYYLVNEKGKIKLPAMATSWLVSPNGEHCAVPFTEEQMKGAKDAAINPNSRVYLLHADSLKTGPIPEYYLDNTHLFTDHGQYIQLKRQEPTVLYVDGNPTIKFPREIRDINAIIFNDRATAGAYFENGTMVFSDGTIIENEAIKPSLRKQDGKIFARWYAIDKQGSIYDCQKEL